MAQFYTLDEAAARLTISVEEFKRRLQTEAPFRTMRPFRDGATLRFRAADVDELARSLGAASDPGLPLGPVGAGEVDSTDDLIFSLPPNPVASDSKSGLGKPAVPPDESEDIFSSGTRQIGLADSDVRLDTGNLPRPTGDGFADNMTEEISLDLSGPASAVIKPSGLSSGNLGKGKADSGKIPITGKTGPDSSSEFELTADPDSDSFEFQLSADSSEEIDLAVPDRDPKKVSGQSGINLAKPSDSGVSLEGKKKPKTGPLPASVDSDDDFALSLSPAPTSGQPRTGTNLSKDSSSDSEFDLTLDSNSGVADAVAASEGQDAMFETDFELPSMDDSSAELMSADSEEFEIAEVDDAVELAVDEGDAVMVVDDDAPLLEDAVELDELDESPSASRALAGVGATPDGYTVAGGPPVVAAAAPWGPLPGIVLLLTLPLVFLGALMGFEVVRGMFGYQMASTPGNALVRGVATSVLGEKLND